jgi:hypothetical protein
LWQPKQTEAAKASAAEPATNHLNPGKSGFSQQKAWSRNEPLPVTKNEAFLLWRHAAAAKVLQCIDTGSARAHQDPFTG